MAANERFVLRGCTSMVCDGKPGKRIRISKQVYWIQQLRKIYIRYLFSPWTSMVLLAMVISASPPLVDLLTGCTAQAPVLETRILASRNRFK